MRVCQKCCTHKNGESAFYDDDDNGVLYNIAIED